MKANTVVSIYDIDWDADTNSLPLRVNYVIPYDMDTEELEDNLSDYLSDEYGFCHKGFSYVVLESVKCFSLIGSTYLRS